MNPALLTIRRFPTKGLGVVTARAVETDELLDLAPVFELALEDVPTIEASSFRHHYFAHPDKDGHGVIVLGAISLFNHAATPNVRLDWRRNPETGWTVGAYARHDLAAGTELTIDYACELWFEPAR